MSRRLLLSYLLLALFVLAVLEIPLGLSYARNERQDLTRKLERDAAALATLSEDVLAGRRGIDRPTLAGIARRYQRETGGRVVITNARGIGLVDTDPPAPGKRSFASRPEFAKALHKKIASGTRRSQTLDAELLYVAVPVVSGGKVRGAVRVSYPTSEITARVTRFWILLAAIAGIVLLAAGLVGRRLAHSIARPLRNVEQAAASAGRGHLDARAPTDAGPVEVRSLAASFNETVEKLDELIRAREEFAADAAHQLRTPLAALRLRLENLERDVAPAGRDDFDKALVEVERLSHLVDGLLALARSDPRSATPETIEVSDVVDERLDAWSPLVSEEDVFLIADVEDDLLARATPGRLEQVLDNLIANALEASPPRTWITVSAAQEGSWVELHVVDEGPGMSAEERARAFDRLWQGDSGKGASGLGLAIVQRLVTSDGGHVELLPARDGGIDAVVRLPASAPYPGRGPLRGRRRRDRANLPA
jgi:signal transduction histidine kinase